MIRTTPSSVVTGRNAQGDKCSETRRTKDEQIGRLAHACVTGTVFDMFVYGSHAIRDIVSDFVAGSGSWEHTDDIARHRINRLRENNVIINPYSTLGEQDAVPEQPEQIRLESGRFEYVERLDVFSTVSRDVLFKRPIFIRAPRYTQRKRVFSECQSVHKPRQLATEAALTLSKRWHRETVPVSSRAREHILSNLER